MPGVSADFAAESGRGEAGPADGGGVNITLPYQWQPRAYQAGVWGYFERGGTRASICGHRRWGKDDVAMQVIAVKAHERVGAYWHLLPEQAQVRKAIWDMVNPHTGKRRIDEAFPEVLRESTRDNEMFIRFKNGSTYQCAGSDNFNSLVGSSPCGLVFSEYALANPQAWAYLRPIVRENGGWALFISTPRGKNHFYQLHRHAQANPTWYAETATVEQTGVLGPEALDAELRELQAEHGDAYGKAMFEQEWYCSFEAAIPGAIWADALDRLQTTGRLTDFAINPKAPVYTGWDLGRTDDTAIWFYQFNGEQLDVIDYFSAPGMEIDAPDDPEHSLTHLLRRKRQQHGITYARHWLPHDARPRRQGMGGKSILQQFQTAAAKDPQLGQFAIVPHLDRQEGIQAARKTFQRTRFHATHCALGLAALRQYHREWDAELKKYTDVPVHDWSSHGADAWRYVSLSWKAERPQIQELTDAEQVQRLVAQSPTGQTFGQLKTQHLKTRRAAREWASA